MQLAKRNPTDQSAYEPTGLECSEETEVAARHLIAGQRRDDAARDSLADAEWVADRQNQIADFRAIGISDGEYREILLALDAQDREIDALVLQHQFARELASIGERDLDVVGTLDDVVVGDHETVMRQDNAGTERYISDWQNTEVYVSVRDARIKEDDALLGIVHLPLHEVFKERSQINGFYPLTGGIGYGRIRISMVWRSVQLQAPMPAAEHLASLHPFNPFHPRAP